MWMVVSTCGGGGPSFPRDHRDSVSTRSTAHKLYQRWIGIGPTGDDNLPGRINHDAVGVVLADLREPDGTDEVHEPRSATVGGEVEVRRAVGIQPRDLEIGAIL